MVRHISVVYRLLLNNGNNKRIKETGVYPWRTAHPDSTKAGEQSIQLKKDNSKQK